MLRWNDRTAPEVVHIEAVKLFPAQRLLMRDAEIIKLGSRSFDILLALVDRPGEVVSQKELIAGRFGRTFLSKTSVFASMLRRCVKRLTAMVHVTSQMYPAAVIVLSPQCAGYDGGTA